jgi:hypothetical protein
VPRLIRPLGRFQLSVQFPIEKSIGLLCIEKCMCRLSIDLFRKWMIGFMLPQHTKQNSAAPTELFPLARSAWKTARRPSTQGSAKIGAVEISLASKVSPWPLRCNDFKIRATLCATAAE